MNFGIETGRACIVNADRAREIPGEQRAEGDADGDSHDDEFPRRERRRGTRARRRAQARRAGDEDEVVLPAGSGYPPRAGGALLDELARRSERGGRHFAPEHVAALIVDGKHHDRAARLHFLHPCAQRLDTAVAQRRRRHVGGNARRGPARKLGRRRLHAAMMQPDGGAGADGGDEEGEPEADEDFPEEPAHRYSLARW